MAEDPTNDPFHSYAEWMARLPRMPPNASPAEQAFFMAEMWRSASANALVLAEVVRKNTEVHERTIALYRELLEARRAAAAAAATAAAAAAAAATGHAEEEPIPPPPMGAPLAVPLLGPPPAGAALPAVPENTDAAPAVPPPAPPVPIAGKDILERLKDLPTVVQVTLAILAVAILVGVAGYFGYDNIRWKDASIGRSGEESHEVAPVEDPPVSGNGGAITPTTPAP